MYAAVLINTFLAKPVREEFSLKEFEDLVSRLETLSKYHRVLRASNPVLVREDTKKVLDLGKQLICQLVRIPIEASIKRVAPTIYGLHQYPKIDILNVDYKTDLKLMTGLSFASIEVGVYIENIGVLPADQRSLLSSECIRTERCTFTFEAFTTS